jgi:hypothetical protein
MKYHEFSAVHKTFYEQFQLWRKELIADNNNGVYQLIANKQVNRLLGTDEVGILYIGKGDILSNNSRVGKFINALNQTEEAHDGGNRFNFQKIKEKYPLANCKIRIILEKDAELLEAKLLDEYLRKFGELPPFNRISESRKMS